MTSETITYNGATCYVLNTDADEAIIRAEVRRRTAALKARKARATALVNEYVETVTTTEDNNVAVSALCEAAEVVAADEAATVADLVAYVAANLTAPKAKRTFKAIAADRYVDAREAHHLGTAERRALSQVLHAREVAAISARLEAGTLRPEDI